MYLYLKNSEFRRRQKLSTKTSQRATGRQRNCPSFVVSGQLADMAVSARPQFDYLPLCELSGITVLNAWLESADEKMKPLHAVRGLGSDHRGGQIKNACCPLSYSALVAF